MWNIPEGKVIETSSEVQQPAPPDARSELSHLLVYGSCIYVLDGQAALVDSHALTDTGTLSSDFRKQLLNGLVAPQFCFPLTVGKTWGRATGFKWQVLTRRIANDRQPIFHVACSLGSGSHDDIWLERGRGVVQERELHEGTYWEVRTWLLHAYTK